MLLTSGLLLIGLIGLIWSADRFVFGSAALARNLGLSPLIIGLTIVAMGSSAPEMMVAATASLNGNSDTAIGNAIGSNITNITLVLGLTALLKPLLVSSSTIRRELPLVLISSAFAVYLLSDSMLTQTEGWILMVSFFLVIGALAWLSLKQKKEGPNDALEDDFDDEIPTDVPTKKALLWLIIGLIALPLSAHILVDAAVDIAKHFGLSDLVIGLTIIAIGTSLPELAASIAGVMKGEDDLALGNIVGSNIFNALAVLALPGIIAPGVVDANIMNRDALIMLGITGILLLMAIGIKKIRSINRIEGALLLAGFIGYQWLLFTQVAG